MGKIKWGVIGCGGIAYRRTIPAMLIAGNAELVAVMDKNKELLQKTGEEYHVQILCESEDELLNQDIDAVYIATPVFCHKEQVLAAIKAGKHVLVEKPISLDVKEAEEIKELAQKENITVCVALMMRFHTYHQQIKDIIASGKLGEIVSMRAQFSCWYPDIEGSWRQNKKLSGGGALVDLGVHCIDLLQYISGTAVSSVFALCDTQTFQYEVDDSASLLMKMSNGAHAYVDVNFNIPDGAVQSKLEFYGTKGSIIADGTLAQVEGGRVNVSLSAETDYDAMQNREAVDSYYLELEEGNIYMKEIENFACTLKHGDYELTGIEEAIYIQKIIEAAYRSSKSRKLVEVE